MQIRKLITLYSVLTFCTYLSAQTTLQTIGAGHTNSNITITGSSSDLGTNINNTVVDEGLLPNLNAASRFLGHATLGADYEAITATSEKGFEDWIDEQMAMPIEMSLKDFTIGVTSRGADSLSAMGIEVGSVSPKREYWHFAWWQYTMTQPDLLRNRIALALSEIFVISEFPELDEEPLGLADYYDMLLRNSFGNFRELLEDVTYHPCMGVYLTHVNNYKSDIALNRFPDENYAREVMQLFTIGLFELNADGSYLLDENGEPIPTYDNDDIIEFSKVFTGLTWGDSFGFGSNANSDLSYTIPMRMNNSWHEPGEKQLLSRSTQSQTVPNRSPVNGVADIDDAFDNLFYHPNVGPFIGYKLIQRLVKSNPSPGYIARVTAAFNDNGQGVRGDMKAVIKAILLDEEAMSCPLSDEAFDGRLREPMIRYTHVARAFNAAAETGLYRNSMDEFSETNFQRPLGSPSVFNFFQPNFQPIGSVEENELVAPEFQITNALSIMGYSNELYKWLIDDKLMEYERIFNDEDYYDSKRAYLNLEDEIAIQEDAQQLIDRLDIILTHGQMTDRTRQLITTAIGNVPEDRSEYRVKLAIYLVMMSPDYLIVK